MKLNLATDMALRIAMLTAPASTRTTVDELAERLDLPRSHVAKVVQRLQRIGVLFTVRGRSGGVAFAEGAERITVGRVVRAFEGEGEVVSCEETGCALRAGCRLRVQLRRAQAAFLAVLDEMPLGELAGGPAAALLLTPVPGPAAARTPAAT
ncbi:Rrf2 family transcriptional regulator [Micromonospora sp. HM134]|uniref:RrF2 family transcriptional regulator n=1 Tax=unclassified Micromonospora TaxID=2617518 RepID=UPI0011985248|nr:MULTISPECIES: Rrf2 family transcriptional regulator [unclassified Micromonospora]QDY07407.1 Rrf2 family transcriptional regulator [Micromonospora sp. HM134]